MRRLLAATIAAITVGGLLTACSPSQNDVSFTGLQVQVDGGTEAQVVPSDLPEAAASEIDALSDYGGFIVGTAVQIEFDGELPSEGAVLTRTYAVPIPEDAAATFVFWDEEFDTWTAVPTTYSEDRRTITATTHHFSLWNDFVAGSQTAIETMRDGALKAGQQAKEWVGNTVQDVGEAMHWGVGNLFTTRVELPECDMPTPIWVTDLPMSFEVNDPVRFCVGHDASQPDLLVVKARANRGYGFPVQLAVDPAWEHNSSFDINVSTVINTIGQLDSTIGASVGQLLNSGRFVAPGQEISFGLDPSAFEDYSAEYLLELPAPSMDQFLVTLLATQLTKVGLSYSDGVLAGALAVASCASKIAGINDVGPAASAILTCLTSADTQFAQLYANVLAKRGLDAVSAGKAAGSAIGKISVYLALMPIAVLAADYVAEVNYPRNARALTISLNEDALSAVPGFPAPLQGEWCVEAPNQGECFALSDLIDKNPGFALRSSSPSVSVPGATDYVLCYVLDLGERCSTAASLFLRYFPEGVEWDCPTMNGFDLACDATDQSAKHDTSRARLVKLANHQQGATYFDAPPMYQL